MYDAKVYGGMQHESMSEKLCMGEQVKCVQIDADEFTCYAGPIIESWVSKQRRYTMVVWKRSGPGEGELMQCGLSGMQAISPREEMASEDEAAMIAAVGAFELGNPKTAYNATRMWR